MGLFGWSLPPGCGTLPGEEDAYCEVCMHNIEECICPVCPVCGEVGSPVCYEQHGMEYTPEQIQARDEAERAAIEEAAAEAEYTKQMREEVWDYEDAQRGGEF